MIAFQVPNSAGVRANPTTLTLTTGPSGGPASPLSATSTQCAVIDSNVITWPTRTPSSAASDSFSATSSARPGSTARPDTITGTFPRVAPDDVSGAIAYRS